MGSRIQVLFLIFSIQISTILAETNADDLSALNALKSSWSNLPPNWSGTDPCGSNWDGIDCNNSRVVEIKLSGIGLEGTEFGDLGSFTELQHLDLSNNLGLKGTLPSSLGNLKNLTTLILVGCSFFGPIPDSIGSLQQLVFIHLSQNQLSGPIPPKLFSPNMKLIHVILDHNQLRGEIPPTLGLVRTLEVVRLDSNTLSGSVPDTLNSLKGLNELYLSNNNLTGPLPNLSSMNTLHYLDMSNNSFEASVIPGWLSSLLSLTTVYSLIPSVSSAHMVNTTLQGSIPVNFFSLPLLETVLTENPICKGNETKENYCIVQNNNNPVLSSDNCPNVNCGSGKIQSPTCKCSHPQTGTLHFFSFAFSNFENLTYFRTLNASLMSAFLSRGLPVDSVSVTDPTIDVYSYLQFRVQIFPSGQDTFNRTGYSDVGFLLNRQPFNVEYFGPFFYKADEYCCFGGSKKSSHTGIIVGVAVGASVFVVLLVCVAVYAFRQRSRANRATEKSNPFASWNPDKSGSVPQLKGARWLAFEEMRKCTDNFSDANCIGVGGYGKVMQMLIIPNLNPI
nr:probable leucine-rich repeat receptor-like protein kinase At5g49770 [Ipomoea batatas]